MKIGDRVFVRGYIDEIRKDTVIIRNAGGYFGTIPSEVITGELPSAEPKLDKNDMPEQGDSAKFGVITGETCAYWDSESNMCALHRPSAQPEIIHCKECKRQDTDNVFRSMWCHEMRTFVKPNEFCSRADMREEEQDE